MTRVRFAPSPTGYLHQGNIRTALFNYLFARQQGGKFILRIDDTDRERSKPEFEESISHDLHWLGIECDEGPANPGSCGPYRQSERESIYEKYLTQLRETGRVYPCYCTPEELEAERRRAIMTGVTFRYRGKCRDLTAGEREAKEAQGIKPSYRFRVEPQVIKFDDLVYGEKTFDTAVMGDFVIARSDGGPLYLFASAIDDALMEISHVIRGEDGLSNAPRQILIQQTLGFSVPQFAHLPLILGPDHTLLSKRNGSASVAELRDKGYLPEALINYLALLGWSPPAGRDILDRDTLVQLFNINKVGRSSAVFDWGKLNHINQVYLRRLPQERYLALAHEAIREVKPGLEGFSAEQIDTTLMALRNNVQTLGEIPGWLSLLLGEPKVTTPEAQEALKGPDAEKVLKTAVALLQEKQGEFDADGYEKFIEQLKSKSRQKGKKLFMPIRVALTGGTEGPELANLFASLGRDKILERIIHASENLQHQEPQ
jgi:glutamyl-tRNA synthetase